MWPELITTLGSAVGSIANSLFGESQSKSLMRYQSKLQQQMIDKANQYNDPAAQMQRLRNAGLSPNLVYNSGGVTGNQSDAGKVSAVNRDAGLDLGIDKAVQTHLQRKVQEQSIKESQWRSLEAMTRATKNMISNKLARATFADSVNQIHANVEHTLQSIKESEQRVDESTQRTSNMKIEANRMAEEMKLLQARTGLTEAQAKTEVCRPELIKNQAKYYLEKSKTEPEQRKFLESLVKLHDAQIEHLGFLCLESSERTMGLYLDNEFQAEINRTMHGGVQAKDAWQMLSKILLFIMQQGSK